MPECGDPLFCTTAQSAARDISREVVVSPSYICGTKNWNKKKKKNRVVVCAGEENWRVVKAWHIEMYTCCLSSLLKISRGKKNKKNQN